MTEFQSQDGDSKDEVSKLIPTDMDEAFAVDGARRSLEGVWNPDDPEWKEVYDAHRLMMQAGLTEPAVNLDRVVANLDEARKAVNEVFDGQNDDSEPN